MQLVYRPLCQKSGELQLDHEESAISAEIFEKPANIVQGDENSDYCSPCKSEVSDWRDQFSIPESGSELGAAESFLESIDSCSYSVDT